MADAAPPPVPVSVLGRGTLGSPLARALLAAGYPATVWNRSDGRVEDLVALGASRAPGPAAAIAASTVVVVAMADEDAVHAVIGPVSRGLTGRTLVDLASGTLRTDVPDGIRVAR